MKKLRIAALLMCFVALSMAMTSCSKSNEDLIVGKWKCTQITGPDASFNGGIGAFYEFKKDKSFTITYDNLSYTGTYSVIEDDLSITVSILSFSTTANFDIEKLDKQTLILDAEDSDGKATFERQ